MTYEQALAEAHQAATAAVHAARNADAVHPMNAGEWWDRAVALAKEAGKAARRVERMYEKKGPGANLGCACRGR